jgi:hypothetical protein
MAYTARSRYSWRGVLTRFRDWWRKPLPYFTVAAR